MKDENGYPVISDIVRLLDIMISNTGYRISMSTLVVMVRQQLRVALAGLATGSHGGQMGGGHSVPVIKFRVRRRLRQLGCPLRTGLYNSQAGHSLLTGTQELWLQSDQMWQRHMSLGVR
jgi:hypothetical protein